MESTLPRRGPPAYRLFPACGGGAAKLREIFPTHYHGSPEKEPAHHSGQRRARRALASRRRRGDPELDAARRSLRAGARLHPLHDGVPAVPSRAAPRADDRPRRRLAAEVLPQAPEEDPGPGGRARSPHRGHRAHPLRPAGGRRAARGGDRRRRRGAGAGVLRRPDRGRLPRRGPRAGARRGRVLRCGLPGARAARGAGGEFHGRRSAPRAVHAPARERVRRRRGFDAGAVRREHRRLRPQGAAAEARVGGAAPARRAARGAPRPAVHPIPAAAALDEPHRGREPGPRRLMGPGELAALGAIAFAGALVFGLTGFGSALITIPLASHFVPLPFALALFALADLVSAFGVGLENPRNAVPYEWTRLVPMILAGTAVGVTALVNLPRAVGMLLLGVFVLSFALYSLVRRPGSRVISSHWVWLAGFVAASPAP